MTCVNCNNWIPDHAEFCQTCGRRLDAKKASSGPSALTVLQIILILAISGVVIFLLIERRKNTTPVEASRQELALPKNTKPQTSQLPSEQPPQTSQPTQSAITPPQPAMQQQVGSPPAPAATPQSRTEETITPLVPSRSIAAMALIPTPLEVPPLMYRSISFTTSSEAVNPRIEGWFRAAGGRGNDIEMTVRRDSASGQVIYATGRVSGGRSLNIPLGAGTVYYLIFDNGFSVLSSRVISGDLQRSGCSPVGVWSR